MASTQTRVYIPDAAAVWLPAEIISVGTDGLLSVDAVYADDDEDEDAAQKKRVSKMPGVDGKGVDALPMQNEAGSPEGAADMCSLGYLHEAAVLYNLRRRYFRELPYTYTGAMCIAINPYQWLERLYRDDIRAEYLARPRAELPPHVYAVSAAAYRGVAELEAGSGKWRGTDQAILVSGESGAGKTETVKIMMRHLASVASVDDGDLDAVDSVVARVLRSQPLLESFGNAKTVRNDNSSRFGKFTQLEFACSRGGKIALVGSRCRTYLLEKSRVVNQAEGERTYHCFYGVARAHPELLVGGLGLDVLTYTRESDLETERIEGVLDADRFATTWEALAIVGVDAESCAALSTLLAAALSLGEVRFAATDASDDNSPSAINGDDAAAALCAAALGIRADAGGATAVELLVKGLTERTMRARAEVYKVPLNAAQASDGRDALAKELYVRAFDWIVARINLSTASVGVDTRVVGLLDIFGFESFAVNRFEQICINYTNEKLQQKFTMDLFKTVQHEYDDERVPWKHVAFPDNAAVLTLIEGRMGVIDVLNEECVRPKGSDEGFVSKLKTLHGGGSDAKEGKLIPHRMRKDQFTVRHYAGDVLYTAEKWLERNADTLQDDLAQLARASDHVLIRQLFDVSHDAPAKGKEKRRGGALNADTVTTKFKAQLASLIDEVEKTEVQYVRCLKPNKLKSKRHYDANMVVEQLRCAGVIEAVRVARAGYPNKLPHAEFVRRFACLAAAPAAAAKGAPAGLAKELVGLPVTDESQGSGLYAMGLTRVYFKAGALEDLERRRSAALALKLVVAQAAYRRHYALKRFVALRRGATLLAAVARRNAAEARY
ncbi:P-loop containing nucleoside triphosphate hydrolase protein, partial [Pelagophyceae sp. CCMP2097]